MLGNIGIQLLGTFSGPCSLQRLNPDRARELVLSLGFTEVANTGVRQEFLSSSVPHCSISPLTSIGLQTPAIARPQSHVCSLPLSRLGMKLSGEPFSAFFFSFLHFLIFVRRRRGSQTQSNSVAQTGLELAVLWLLISKCQYYSLSCHARLNAFAKCTVGVSHLPALSPARLLCCLEWPSSTRTRLVQTERHNYRWPLDFEDDEGKKVNSICDFHITEGVGMIFWIH